MYIKIKYQEKIIRKAIKKAGSYRKLSKLTKIPRSSIFEYCRGRPILEERFYALSKLLEKDLTVLEKLPDNWKQVRGGKKLIEIKKQNGTFDKEMKRWQDFQAQKLKRWHRFMRINKPKEYYKIQYSRFKKIGEYKYETDKGEKVRNKLEKEIADKLNQLRIKYEYEPLVNVEDNYFFPDFLINNKVIVECTMWKGFEKAYKLKNKVDVLKKKYRVYVVIPKTLYSYYKILNSHLILGLDEFVPVAQTFTKERSNR